MKKDIKKIINIDAGTEINIQGKKISVKGKLGTLERVFKFKDIQFKKEDNKLILSKEKAGKNNKKIMNTIAAHIANMIKGSNEGFEYKLQICSMHFPINVKVDKEKGLFIVKNFIGENKDRIIKIHKDVELDVKGDTVTIKSADKEIGGQQAADIESRCKIKNKDCRIYQDGIWIISKAGKDI